jgi:hypothetical protein
MTLNSTGRGGAYPHPDGFTRKSLPPLNLSSRHIILES